MDRMVFLRSVWDERTIGRCNIKTKIRKSRQIVSKLEHLMDLNALADFALVAANGGLGKASRASGRSKATLSRRIADLEEQLGVRLIERHARGLRPTEAGELLMARTEGPMHD